MVLPNFLAMFSAPSITFPGGDAANLMIFRWIHFLAGITWIGLLYFFNLVNVPFMKEMDAATKAKIIPSMLSRALWWFRWGAVVTVLVGLAYWGNGIIRVDASNGRGTGYPSASSGHVMVTFFLIWTIVFAVMYVAIMVVKVNRGPVLGGIVSVVVALGAYLFLDFNNHGWESNRLLSIGVGGGMGWVMMLNVWGIIWRMNKKIIAWNKDFAHNGTPIPAQAAAMARMGFLASRANAWLSIVMLFFMGAASHYPMLGR
jgi:uncharacterized membrane protein